MQNKKKGCFKIFIVVTIILIVGGIWAWDSMNTWGYRKALPSSAKEIDEWFWEEGFLPDYLYHLRAKITRSEFLEYVAYFEMTPHTEDRIYDDNIMCLSWQPFPGFEGDWWNPGESLEQTYVWQSGDTWCFAKYIDGYIYVSGLNH